MASRAPFSESPSPPKGSDCAASSPGMWSWLALRRGCRFGEREEALRDLLCEVAKKGLVVVGRGGKCCVVGWVGGESGSGRIALLVGLRGGFRRRSARSGLCLVWWVDMLGCLSCRLCGLLVDLVGYLGLRRSVVIEACGRRRCCRRRPWAS
jgi:hypothetical protein